MNNGQQTNADRQAYADQAASVLTVRNEDLARLLKNARSLGHLKDRCAALDIDNESLISEIKRRLAVETQAARRAMSIRQLVATMLDQYEFDKFGSDTMRDIDTMLGDLAVLILPPETVTVGGHEFKRDGR